MERGDIPKGVMENRDKKMKLDKRSLMADEL